MSDRIVSFIEDELDALDIPKRKSGRSYFIRCPFHDDRTPSGGVNLDTSKTVPLGWFSCFGCGKSVSWNTLAGTLGLKQLKKRSQIEVTSGDYADPARAREALLGTGSEEDATDREIERDNKRLTFFEFPPELTKWRGFKTDFLASLGCKYAFYEGRDDEGEFIIWIPCVVNERVVGHVKAYLEKVEDRPSYKNSLGSWSRTKGLLFFDSALQMMHEQGHKTIVLCEGPRDALRCLRFGIPAMCILGTQSWSDQKRLLLEQSDAENLILFMDGDKPGKKATRMLVKSIKGYFNFKYMNLWKHERGWDPGNCPKRFLRRVKNALTSF